MKNDAALWDITVLGAILFAKDLRKFDYLARKSIRVISYKGKSRLDGVKEKYFYSGYAKSYEEAVEYILAIIPQEEIIKGTTRKSVLSYPEIAVREIIANMIIHQEIASRGTNPMVEIFSDRIEFSNTGAPLVPIERIVNTVPVSRNEGLAGFMHKIGKCEERGSGYDKIIASTSQRMLIAPRIENQDGKFTKVVLFSRMPFDITTKEDRIRTCYMLTCLFFVNFNAVSNADIREVFGLSVDESYKASRILKDTLELGLIKPNETKSPRYTKYLPAWA